jgi:hypothetical protein
MDAALAVQKNNLFESEVDAEGKIRPKPRTLLIDKVLPKPTRAQAINFKDAYAKAFDEMKQRLRGRDKPTTLEINNEVQIDRVKKGSGQLMDLGPWGPIGETSGKEKTRKDRTVSEILRDYPRARAADKVARGIRMYVADNALLRQTRVFTLDVPTAVEIWQAQMSLWIQQDLAAVLARMNDERASRLEQEGAADRAWAAYMPVKHLLAVRIDNRLGKGGGSNLPKNWAASFTGINNDDRLFKVPLQLEVVIEESALMDLLDRICKAGFYTPINVNYGAVKPNPLFEDYIYGEAPTIRLVIDLEAYYFRAVFEGWIPDELKKVLKTPDAGEGH